MEEELDILIKIEETWKINDYNNCLLLCSKLILLSPSTRPSLYIKRGLCYLILMKYKEAFNDAQDALNMQPHLSLAHALFSYASYELFKSYILSSDSSDSQSPPILLNENKKTEFEFLAVIHIIRARHLDPDIYYNNNMFIKYWNKIENDVELPNVLRNQLISYSSSNDSDNNNDNNDIRNNSQLDHLMLRDDQIIIKSYILIVLCIFSSHTRFFSSRGESISWILACIQDIRTFSEFRESLEKMERSLISLYSSYSNIDDEKDNSNINNINNNNKIPNTVESWNKVRNIWLYSLQKAETITQLFICLKCFYSIFNECIKFEAENRQKNNKSKGYLSKVHSCAKILSVSIELNAIGDIGLSSSSEGECDLINIILLESGIKICSNNSNISNIFEFDCSVHLRIALSNLFYRRNLFSNFVRESDYAINICNLLIPDEKDTNKILSNSNRLLHHYPGMESYRNIVLEQYLALLHYREEVLSKVSEDNPLELFNDKFSLSNTSALSSNNSALSINFELEELKQQLQNKFKYISLVKAKPMVKLFFSARNQISLEAGITTSSVNSSISIPTISSISKNRIPSRSPSPTNSIASASSSQFAYLQYTGQEDQITFCLFQFGDISIPKNELYKLDDNIDSPIKIWNFLNNDEKKSILISSLDVFQTKLKSLIKQLNIESNPWILYSLQDIHKTSELINLWLEPLSISSQIQLMRIKQTNVKELLNISNYKSKLSSEAKIVSEDIQYIKEKLEEIQSSINCGPVQFYESAKVAQLVTDIQDFIEKGKFHGNQLNDDNSDIFYENDDYLTIEKSILNERETNLDVLNSDKDFLSNPSECDGHLLQPLILLDQVVAAPLLIPTINHENETDNDNIGVESIIHKIIRKKYSIIGSYEAMLTQNKRTNEHKSKIFDPSRPSFRLGLIPRNANSYSYNCVWKPHFIIAKQNEIIKGQNSSSSHENIILLEESTDNYNQHQEQDIEKKGNRKKKKNKSQKNKLNDINDISFIQNAIAQSSMMKPLAICLSQLNENIDIPIKVNLFNENRISEKKSGKIYEFELLKKINTLLKKEINNLENIENVHQIIIDLKLSIELIKQSHQLIISQITHMKISDNLFHFVEACSKFLTESPECFKIIIKEQMLNNLIDLLSKRAEIKKEIDSISQMILLNQEEIKNDEILIEKNSHVDLNTPTFTSSTLTNENQKYQLLLNEIENQVLAKDIRIPQWLVPLAKKKHELSEMKNKLTWKVATLRIFEYKVYENFGYTLKRIAETVLVSLLKLTKENDQTNSNSSTATATTITTTIEEMNMLYQKFNIPLHEFQTIMWKAEELDSLSKEELSEIKFITDIIYEKQNSEEYKLVLIENSAKVLSATFGSNSSQNGEEKFYFPFLIQKIQDIKDLQESLHEATKLAHGLSVFNINYNTGSFSFPNNGTADQLQNMDNLIYEKDLEQIKYLLALIESIRKNKMNQIQDIIDSRVYCETEILRKITIRNQLFYSILGKHFIDLILQRRDVELRLEIEKSLPIRETQQNKKINEKQGKNLNQQIQIVSNTETDNEKIKSQNVKPLSLLSNEVSETDSGIEKINTSEQKNDNSLSPIIITTQLKLNDNEKNSDNFNDNIDKQWVPVGSKSSRANKSKNKDKLDQSTEIQENKKKDKISHQSTNPISIPSTGKNQSKTASKTNKPNKKDMPKEENEYIKNDTLSSSSHSTDESITTNKQYPKQQKQHLNNNDSSNRNRNNNSESTWKVQSPNQKRISSNNSKQTPKANEHINKFRIKHENEMKSDVINPSHVDAIIGDGDNNNKNKLQGIDIVNSNSLTNIENQHQVPQVHDTYNDYLVSIGQNLYNNQGFYQSTTSIQAQNSTFQPERQSLSIYVRPSSSYFYNNFLPLYIIPEQSDPTTNIIHNYSPNDGGTFQPHYQNVYQNNNNNWYNGYQHEPYLLSQQQQPQYVQMQQYQFHSQNYQQEHQQHQQYYQSQ